MIARAISIRSSSMRCCGRSAKLTAGAAEAERVGVPAPVSAKWTPTEAELKEYDGNYPLSPAIALRVFTTGAKLFVQGSSGRPLEVASVDKDIFVAERVGAEIDFERDANGKVIALTLKQGGQVLHGERH
jgi:serine-type D-Ala-D-Ala carboxypeptidase/endopeptidase